MLISSGHNLQLAVQKFELSTPGNTHLMFREERTEGGGEEEDGTGKKGGRRERGTTVILKHQYPGGERHRPFGPITLSAVADERGSADARLGQVKPSNLETVVTELALHFTSELMSIPWN